MFGADVAADRRKLSGGRVRLRNRTGLRLRRLRCRFRRTVILLRCAGRAAKRGRRSSGRAYRLCCWPQQRGQPSSFGKLALGFLRKLSRDQITQRTMEITAAGRPMLATAAPMLNTAAMRPSWRRE